MTEKELWDKIPAYLRIKLSLAKQIQEGQLAPGEKLPSEDELCATFGVARGTVRQALNELSNEGAIYKVHGRGTFVKSTSFEHEIENSRFISFLDELTEKGVPFTTKLVGCGVQAPDKDVARILGIDPKTEKVHTIRRLRSIADKPAMYSINHIPVSLHPSLCEEGDSFDSVYGLLRTKCGINITSGQRLISSVSATEEIAGILGVARGYPVIFAQQRVYDETGRCVDCADIWLRSENFTFSITMKKK